MNKKEALEIKANFSFIKLSDDKFFEWIDAMKRIINTIEEIASLEKEKQNLAVDFEKLKNHKKTIY